MKSRNKAFTLIELLVVIAIIGILASVVIASLNSARSKAADAAIKSNLANIRPEAEMYYDLFGRYRRNTGVLYSGDCNTSGTLFRDISGGEAELIAGRINSMINAASGNSIDSAVRRCYTDDVGQQYAVYVRLKTSSNWWCIDSSGAGLERATPSGAPSCS